MIQPVHLLDLLPQLFIEIAAGLSHKLLNPRKITFLRLQGQTGKQIRKIMTESAYLLLQLLQELHMCLILCDRFLLRPDLILSRGIHGQELHPEQGNYNERKKEYAITHARRSIRIQPVQYLPDTHQKEAEKKRSRRP